MLPPPLAQAADKKSVSPSVEAHLKDAPNLYGRVRGFSYCFLCCFRARWCLQASSFFCALSVAASEADFRASRARERRRFHSRYDAGRKLKESSSERALLVGRLWTEVQTVSGPQRLNFPKTPPQAEAHQNLCSKPFLEIASRLVSKTQGILREKLG